MSSCCSNALLIATLTFWRARSALERYIIIAILALTLTGIGLLIGLIIRVLSSNFENCNTENTTSDAENVCKAHECIQSASKILETMDTEVEPCDDFYKFACGKFLKTTVIPDHQDFVGSFGTVKDKVYEQLKIIIEKEIQSEEPKPFKLVKNLYKACMNTSSINAKGLTPALGILKKLGGWPVIEGYKWRSENFEWKRATIQLRKLGIPVVPFFDVRVEPDVENSARRMIVIDQHSARPELELNIISDHPSPHYSSQNFKFQHSKPNLDNTYTDEYNLKLNFMVDIAVIFGADPVMAKKDMKLVLQLQAMLDKLSDIQQGREMTYRKMYVGMLSHFYPSIPWKNYFKALLEPIIQIWNYERILIKSPIFFEHFERLIKGTPKRDQANFFMYKVVIHIIRYLNDDIHNRQLKYFADYMGQIKWEPRWKKCINEINSNIHLGVSALYVQKYFNRESKKTVAEMMNNIQQEFKKILKQAEWMNENIRQSALEKVDSMRTHIAYPDELFDDKKLNEFYKWLEITPDNYLKAMRNVTIFNTDYSISLLRKPVNSSDWVTHDFATLVNAFYRNNENSIAIPAGILQSPFFKNDRPRFLNYGSIGFILAHEMMHGFNFQGRNYDREARNKYNLNANCLVSQYQNYTVEENEMNVNGLATLRENTADNEGVKISYLAYQEWVKRNGPEPKLPGLVYTPSQLFWISTAQKWCEKLKPEYLRKCILYDTHSPHEFRITGSLSNSLEFAKDFKCPVICFVHGEKAMVGSTPYILKNMGQSYLWLLDAAAIVWSAQPFNCLAYLFYGCPIYFNIYGWFNHSISLHLRILLTAFHSTIMYKDF